MSFKPPKIPLTPKQREIVDGPRREPSSTPQQLRREGRSLVRGQKRRGAGVSLSDEPELADLVDRGYQQPGRPVVINDRRPEAKTFPLTDLAYRLLKEYMKREPFWWAVTGLRFSVEDAGSIYLEAARAKSYKVYNELLSQEEDENLTRPMSWLRSAVTLGIREGRIRRGRETESGPWANAFFLALAGGSGRAANFMGEADASGPVIDIRQIPCKQQIDKEIRDYLIHSHLWWRLNGE
jgi:hypothetical protein